MHIHSYTMHTTVRCIENYDSVCRLMCVCVCVCVRARVCTCVLLGDFPLLSVNIFDEHVRFTRKCSQRATHAISVEL